MELGEKFSFSVQDIRSFTLHTRDGWKKLWVISVSAPELEALRENYGCSPKLKGHDFHITLGKQVPVAPEGWREVEVLSPLNLEGEPTENLASEGDFVELENSELLATATKVDAVGQLCIKGNGFTYLDVNNRFVAELMEGLPVEGAFTAISTNAKRMGAHISVIYEDEMIGKEIWTLSEAGQWFTFEVRALRYVDRKAAGGRERLWLLAAWAPGLERLRRSYGLRPKLQGHDFHITLGKEVLPSE